MAIKSIIQYQQEQEAKKQNQTQGKSKSKKNNPYTFKKVYRETPFKLEMKSVELQELVYGQCAINFGIKDNSLTKNLRDAKVNILEDLSSHILDLIFLGESHYPDSLKELHERTSAQNNILASCREMKAIYLSLKQTFNIDDCYSRAAVPMINEIINMTSSWKDSNYTVYLKSSKYDKQAELSAVQNRLNNLNPATRNNYKQAIYGALNEMFRISYKNLEIAMDEYFRNNPDNINLEDVNKIIESSLKLPEIR